MSNTTASSLKDVWRMLSKRSDLWDKLQSELNELNNKPPLIEQLQEMEVPGALLKAMFAMANHEICNRCNGWPLQSLNQLVGWLNINQLNY